MPPQYQTYEPSPELGRYYREVLQRSANPVDFKAVYNEGLKEKQAIEAQQLNQQAVQLSVNEKQRAAAQEKAQAEAIAAQFGNMDPNAPVDMNKVWDIVQRTAIKNNDIKTATDIERATRESGSKKISPAIATRLGLPPGTTEAEARLVGYKTHTDNVQGRFDNPIQQARREYGAIKAYQEITGTKIRQPTNSQEEEFKSLSNLRDFASNTLETYLPYISENRLVRWGEINVNSNSAVARFKNELVQLTYSLAAAYNGKKISETDYKFMAPLLEPQPFDTLETVEDKVRRALEFADISKENLVGTAEALGRNLQGLGTGRNSASAIDIKAVPPPNFGAQQPDPNAIAQQYGQPGPTPTGPPAPNSGRTPEQEARYQKVKAARAAQLEAGGQ